MASEYGWIPDIIEGLTYKRIKNLLRAAEERKEQEEYLERLHIGLQAVAIVKALGASFDKKEISMDDLIGKAPGEKENENEKDLDEWRENAGKRGLRFNT